MGRNHRLAVYAFADGNVRQLANGGSEILEPASVSFEHWFSFLGKCTLCFLCIFTRS